jgi:hypothetical protein
MDNFSVLCKTQAIALAACTAAGLHCMAAVRTFQLPATVVPHCRFQRALLLGKKDAT